MWFKIYVYAWMNIAEYIHADTNLFWYIGDVWSCIETYICLYAHTCLYIHIVIGTSLFKYGPHMPIYKCRSRHAYMRTQTYSQKCT
jgi:hypothetical protein